MQIECHLVQIEECYLTLLAAARGVCRPALHYFSYNFLKNKLEVRKLHVFFQKRFFIHYIVKFVYTFYKKPKK